MLSTLRHHTTISLPQATQLAPSSSTTSATDPGTHGETRSGRSVEVLPSQEPKARSAHAPSGEKDKIRPLSDRSVQAKHDGSTDPVPLPMDTKETIRARPIDTTPEPTLRGTSRLLERVRDSKESVDVDLQRDHLVMVGGQYLLHLDCEPGDFPLALRSDEYDLDTCKAIARELGARLVPGDDPEKPVAHYLIDRACPTSITSTRLFNLEFQDKVRDGEPIILKNGQVLFADGESLVADPELVPPRKLSDGKLLRTLILRGHYDYRIDHHGVDDPGIIVSPMQMPRHILMGRERETSESDVHRPIWRIGEDPEFIEPSSLTSDREKMKELAKKTSRGENRLGAKGFALPKPIWVTSAFPSHSMDDQYDIHLTMVQGPDSPALTHIEMEKIDQVALVPSIHLHRFLRLGNPLIIGKDVIGYWMGPYTNYWNSFRHIAIPMLSMVQQHIKISDIEDSVVVIMASDEYARGIPSVLLRMKIESASGDDVGASLYILDASNNQLDGALNVPIAAKNKKKGAANLYAVRPQLIRATLARPDDKKDSRAGLSQMGHHCTDPWHDPKVHLAYEILSVYDSTTTLALHDLADSMRTIVDEAVAALLDAGDDFSCSEAEQHDLLSTLDNYVQIRQALHAVRMEHVKALKARIVEARSLTSEDPSVTTNIAKEATHLCEQHDLVAKEQQRELDSLRKKIKSALHGCQSDATRSLLKMAVTTFQQSAAAQRGDIRQMSIAAMEKLAPRMGMATARTSPAVISIALKEGMPKSRREVDTSVVSILPPTASTPYSLSAQAFQDLMAQKIQELTLQKKLEPKEPLPPARVQRETKRHSTGPAPRTSVAQPIKQPLPKPATASTPVTVSTPVTAPEPPKPTREEEQAAKLQRHLDKQIERGSGLSSSQGSSGDSASGSASASRSPWHVSLASSGASAGSAPLSASASVSSITPAQKTKALQTPLKRFRDAIRVMQDLGLTLTRIKGSHAQFTADGRGTATIPGAALVSQQIPKHKQRDIQNSIKRM